ncbi:hypothetical protein [Glycomyces harbinensis]|nr:hypothetical protein [Glycomyces harbinensis]
MEPLRTRPAYHHPIPWQVVAALVLIGASVCSLTYLAALMWADFRSPTEEAVLWPLVATAAAAAAQVAVAVCIAARMNWARIIGFGTCMLTGVVAFASGLAAGLDVPSYTGIGIGLVLFFLLRSEKAKRHTYKGGGASWPED